MSNAYDQLSRQDACAATGRRRAAAKRAGTACQPRAICADLAPTSMPHTTPSDAHERPAVRASAEPVGRLTAADVWTGHEVAEFLHAPVSTVEDWARRGILPSCKIGRRRLYVRHNIEAVLTGRPTR
jgi:hypothetical protein